MKLHQWQEWVLIKMYKTRTEPGKIASINEEFFGEDKGKNYLKHDFRRTLEGFIQQQVLRHVMKECSKERHNKKKSKNEAEKVVSTAYGDFDPDDAGFLYSILKNHELGTMIDIRLLLKKEEAGAGGKFVKDITKLKTEDFVDYYKHSEEGKIHIPSLLLGQFLKNHKNDPQLSASNFLDSRAKEIKHNVEELVDKAKIFNDKNYSKLLLKDYEELKFHKNRQPKKYEIFEDIESLGAINLTLTTRRDKSKVELHEISKALNEFAEIIALYQTLVSKNTSFYGSSWPLDTYVQRTFALFRKDIPLDSQQKVIDSMAKHLNKALNVAGWRITDSNKDRELVITTES